MAVYSTAIVGFEKQITRFVKIELPRCNNVFSDGVASGGFCLASGTPICYYSYETCRDKANYKPTTRALWFQSKDMPIASIGVGNVYPYLSDVTPIATRINPEYNTTENARMTFTFEPDYGDNAPLPVFDSDKFLPSGTAKYNANTSGEYWRNLIRRYPNITRARILYYEGVSPASTSDLQLRFAGYIGGIEFQSNGGVKISAADLLKKNRNTTVPNAIKTTNVTPVEVALTDRIVRVQDASQFELTDKLAFALTNESNTLYIKNIDPTDGTVTSYASKAALSSGSYDLCWDNNAKKFLTIEPTGTANQARLWNIDPWKGTWTSEGDYTGTAVPTCMTYDYINSVTYASDGTRLYTVNRTAVSITAVGAHTAVTDIQGLAYDHITQTLYGIDDTTDSLYTINVSTGVATIVGAGFGLAAANYEGLSHQENDDTLYAYDTTNSRLVKIDKTAGTAEVHTSISLTGAHGVVFADYFDSFVKLADTDPTGTGDDWSEYWKLIYPDAANNRLYVVRSALMGTTARAHNTLGLKMIQIAPFCSRTASNTTTGLKAVNAILELLLGWAGFKWYELDIDTFIDDREEWLANTEVARVMEKPLKVDGLIDQLRQICGASIWQAENQKITFKVFKPINQHLETLTTLTDAENILREPEPMSSTDYDMQISRVEIFFNPVDSSLDSQKPEDYISIYIIIDADSENENNFNEVRSKQIFQPWIRSETMAKEVGTRLLRRFRLAPANMKIGLDKKNYAIATGDIVAVNSKEILDTDGTADTINMQVLSRSEERDFIELEMLDAKMSKTYGFIGHAGAADWLAATTVEKYHAYIGTGVELDASGVATKAQMSDGTDGYYIF